MKYRVVEKNDVFIIQKQMQETKGYLWWKKTFDVWYCCDCYGFPVYGGVYQFRPVANYTSLSSAKWHIKKWQQPAKEIIYHNID